MAKTKYLLVVGEAGDGKSTLIKNLKLPEEEEPKTGRSMQGVTKTLGIYRACPLEDGNPVVLLDTPGIGDHDVTPMKLIAMIEEVLKAEGFQQETGGGLDGILVTSPTNKPRFGLGGQVVKILVDKGFVGDKKWDSVILVGTKHDRADEEDIASFVEEMVPLFFKENDGKGRYAFTSLQESSKVLEVVLSLPNMKVSYEPPAPEEFANAVADTMGMDKDALTKELTVMREAAAKEAEAMKAEVEKLKMELQAKQSSSTAQMATAAMSAASGMATSALSGYMQYSATVQQASMADAAARRQEAAQERQAKMMQEAQERQAQQQERLAERQMEARRAEMQQQMQNQQQMRQDAAAASAQQTQMMAMAMASSGPACAVM